MENYCKECTTLKDVLKEVPFRSISNREFTVFQWETLRREQHGE